MIQNIEIKPVENNMYGDVFAEVTFEGTRYSGTVGVHGMADETIARIEGTAYVNNVEIYFTSIYRANIDEVDYMMAHRHGSWADASDAAKKTLKEVSAEIGRAAVADPAFRAQMIKVATRHLGWDIESEHREIDKMENTIAEKQAKIAEMQTKLDAMKSVVV